MTVPESQIANARFVTANTVVDGTVVVRDGVIAAVDSGASVAVAHDWDGDCLVPGLVEWGVDWRHEDLGAEWLATWFPLAVTEPIRPLVTAKRCPKE